MHKIVAVHGTWESVLHPWRRISQWLAQDSGPFLPRAALLYTGMGLTADTLSQTISLLTGHADAWDPARTTAMLTFPACDAHLLPHCWNALSLRLPEHAPSNPEGPGGTEFRFARTRYYQSKLVRLASRALYDYIFLQGLRGAILVAWTVGLQAMYGTGGIGDIEDVGAIPHRLLQRILLGPFWIPFIMYNVRESISIPERLRNNNFIAFFWAIVSTAVASGSTLPVWGYILPFLATSVLAAKALRK